MMKPCLALIGLFWIVPATVHGPVSRAAEAPGTAPAGEPLKVIMLVGGVYHDYDRGPAGLADALSADGQIAVTVVADPGRIRESVLAGYDVMVLHTCTERALPDEQRAAIMAALRGGKGLVGLHCALWSFQDWPEFREMLGALVLAHDPLGPFTVVNVDPGHPIMQGLPAEMTFEDEPYVMDWWGGNNHVLLRTAGPHGEQKATQPVAWTTRARGARVFVTTLGHDARTLGDRHFLTLLSRGLLWAGGRLGPPTMLSDEERREGFIPLFNGRNLEGWRYDPRLWQVRDGILIGNSHPDGLEHNSNAITEEAFSDFILRFSVRLISGNSGVQFRSIEWPDYQVAGYQADVVLPFGWGNLHEQEGRRRLVDGWTGRAEHAVAKGDWNDMEVMARGRHIVLRTNGVVTADYHEEDMSRPLVGIIGLQLHRGEPMEVHFTNIRIRPLAPTEVESPTTHPATAPGPGVAR